MVNKVAIDADPVLCPGMPDFRNGRNDRTVSTAGATPVSSVDPEPDEAFPRHSGLSHAPSVIAPVEGLLGQMGGAHSVSIGKSANYSSSNSMNFPCWGDA